MFAVVFMNTQTQNLNSDKITYFQITNMEMIILHIWYRSADVACNSYQQARWYCCILRLSQKC